MQKSLRSALVSTKWLKEVVNNRPSNHRILDASWYLPYANRNAAEEYKSQHIPGAAFFDIDKCVDKSNPTPFIIPPAHIFEEYVGKLGINNDTHVIVYDNHFQFPLFSAQRAWWNFRVLGHDKVSVLDGGMQKWLKEDGPTTAEIEDVPKETFKAKFVPHLFKKYEDIEDNIKDSNFQLIDARPEGRFKGRDPEPEKGVKSGCILGSTSIPFTDMLDLDDFCMKSPDEISRVFVDKGIDINKPLVATCGYGITAGVLALAAHECGNNEVGIYNGSWTEWFLKAPDNLKKNVPSD